MTRGVAVWCACVLALIAGLAGSASAQGNPAKAAPAAATEKPGEGVWANYDFVPGEKVIFAEDFTNDQVGNFPQRLTFKKGNLEIVEWKGQRWLRGSKSNFVYELPLPQVLPERFTMEFDVYQPYGRDLEICIAQPCRGLPGKANQYLFFGGASVGVWGDGGGTVRYVRPGKGPESLREIVHVALRADGNYLKMYLGANRIANIPNSKLGRSKTITFSQYFSGTPEGDNATMIGNIRIAAGGTPIYEALMSKGRVATRGIFFDTNSDVIRPESTPTLNEIAGMLTQHAELKLAIEGHTDSVGDDKANLTLSQKRAESVKRYLVDNKGIAAERLTPKGLGESKPAAPNTTEEGRQQNRRVELVKL